MSQYRDDRRAARLRIEALEARLADREADLARCGMALADRDEEILRLQRELELAGGLGPRHRRSVSAAWASRIVGAATGLAIAAAGAGIVLVRGSASAGPPTMVVVTEVEATPIHADPLVTGPVDWSWQPVEAAAAPLAGAPGTVPGILGDAREHPLTIGARPPTIRRQTEPRVWGGRASRDEIRMRKALCAPDDDPACRERARADLERARAEEP